MGVTLMNLRRLKTVLISQQLLDMTAVNLLVTEIEKRNRRNLLLAEDKDQVDHLLGDRDLLTLLQRKNHPSYYTEGKDHLLHTEGKNHQTPHQEGENHQTHRQGGKDHQTRQGGKDHQTLHQIGKDHHTHHIEEKDYQTRSQEEKDHQTPTNGEENRLTHHLGEEDGYLIRHQDEQDHHLEGCQGHQVTHHQGKLFSHLSEESPAHQITHPHRRED